MGKTLASLSIDSKVNQETLLNIFRNYIPNKRIKCGYRQPPWMIIRIKRFTKLTKRYYKNGQKKSDHEKLLEKFSD